MKNEKCTMLDKRARMVGGSLLECARDSFALWDCQLLDEHWNTIEVLENWRNISTLVDEAWLKAGVEVVSKPLGGSIYKIDGKMVSRADALTYLLENYGDNLRKIG